MAGERAVCRLDFEWGKFPCKHIISSRNDMFTENLPIFTQKPKICLYLHIHLSIFMVVNYIYNEDGQAEYAIIPIYMWNMLESQVSKIALPQPEIQGKKGLIP